MIREDFMLEMDFNTKWQKLINEIANSNLSFNQNRYVTIGTYNIFRYMTKHSKVGYDCLICYPAPIMEILKKEERVVLMKNEIFYFCNHGWNKNDELNKHLDKMKKDDNGMFSWEDYEYMFEHSEELSKLFRERSCASCLIEYFNK